MVNDAAAETDGGAAAPLEPDADMPCCCKSLAVKVLTDHEYTESDTRGNGRSAVGTKTGELEFTCPDLHRMLSKWS